MISDELKRSNERLFGVLSTINLPYKEKNVPEDEIDTHIKSLEQAWTEPNSTVEIDWLTHAAEQWHVQFSRLGITKSIRFPPKENTQPPPFERRYWTSEQIEKWLSDKAYFVGIDRGNHRARVLSDYVRDPSCLAEVAHRPARILEILGGETEEIEAKINWMTANTHLAWDVFLGKINFVTQIPPEAYWRLENQWLDDMKQLWAYHLFRRRNGGWGKVESDVDYLLACELIDKKMRDRDSKYPYSDFSEVKNYITQKYLWNGQFLLNFSEPRSLYTKKLDRFRRVEGHHGGDKEILAYTKLFYEKIIPAVESHNQIGQLKHYTNQLYELLSCIAKYGRCDSVINCFEVTVFRYFVIFGEEAVQAKGLSKIRC